MTTKEQILIELKNRKKHDKHSLAYILKIIEHYRYMYSADWKRAELEAAFEKELDKDANIDKVLRLNGFKHITK